MKRPGITETQGLNTLGNQRELNETQVKRISNFKNKGNNKLLKETEIENKNRGTTKQSIS